MYIVENNTNSMSSRKQYLTEYELEREERIKNNQEKMKKMGIDVLAGRSMMITSNKTRTKQNKKKKKRRSFSDNNNNVPLRRSTRHSATSTTAVKLVNFDDDNINTNEGNAQGKEEEEDNLVFETSAVWSYCREKETTITSNNNKDTTAARVDNNNITNDNNNNSNFKLGGYKEQHNCIKLVDESVKKGYYSIDEERNFGLIAAAGDGGIVSIFSSSLLMSYKAHNGWCSNAQFLKNSPNKIITAGGMDGTVALWNIAEQNAKQKIPILKTRNGDIHESGIFSMHVFDENNIFTSSKDKSFCCSTVSDSSITVVRRFDSFHSGVVKCVKAKNANMIATCGNDGVVGIWDLRVKDEQPIIQFENAHGGCAVNFVDWNVEGSSNQLLTSAFDDSINLWDIRNNSGLVYRFRGHSHPGIKKIRMLYCPTFTFDGKAIVTAGEGSSSLTIYDIGKQRKVCSGNIGFDPTCLQSLSGGRIAVANKREVSIFLPVYSLDIYQHMTN